MTTNTQVHETADPEPETFTVTIDPTKVDPVWKTRAACRGRGGRSTLA